MLLLVPIFLECGLCCKNSVVFIVVLYYIFYENRGKYDDVFGFEIERESQQSC